MVGALSVVGSSLVHSKTCPCLCLKIFQRHLISRKYKAGLRPLELNSSFLDCSSIKALSGFKNLRKQRKNKSLVIVDELAGQYEDNFEDVKRQILDYFTYKAVRTVLNQLYEMNPTQYRWFYNYVASNEHGFGKTFIRNLGKKCDHTEMYERISDQNLELMRERLKETVIWPSDDSNTELVG